MPVLTKTPTVTSSCWHYISMRITLTHIVSTALTAYAVFNCELLPPAHPKPLNFSGHRFLLLQTLHQRMYLFSFHILCLITALLCKTICRRDSVLIWVNSSPKQLALFFKSHYGFTAGAIFIIVSLLPDVKITTAVDTTNPVAAILPC